MLHKTATCISVTCDNCGASIACDGETRRVEWQEWRRFWDQAREDGWRGWKTDVWMHWCPKCHEHRKPYIERENEASRKVMARINEEVSAHHERLEVLYSELQAARDD